MSGPRGHLSLARWAGRAQVAYMEFLLLQHLGATSLPGASEASLLCTQLGRLRNGGGRCDERH